MDNISSEKDLIYRTHYWDVRLNPNQKYLGRCVVVLRRPCPRLPEITTEEIYALMKLAAELEALITKTFGATMFNWSCLMNNAYQHTPPDPQVHWHLVPRYDHAVEFNGKNFQDERFGYRSVSKNDIVSDGMFDAIAGALRKNYTPQ